MQQDEQTLTRLLTELPSPPDAEAALVAIHKRIDDGEGREALPKDLFAGIGAHASPDVLVLHPTATGGEPARRPRTTRMWAWASATAAGMAVAAGVTYSVRPAPQVVVHHEPAPPTELSIPARPESRAAAPVADDLNQAQAVIAMGALHDEDPTVKEKPKRGRAKRSRQYRRARNVWRKGRLAYESGDPVAAQASFSECLTIDATHSACLNSLGRIAADNHDAAAAERRFEQARVADPRNPYPMVNLATLAMLGRRFDDAQALLSTALEASPDLAVARRLQARLQYLRERQDTP